MSSLEERQAGDHLARQEVSSPSFAHPRSDPSVESYAEIVLVWQQPNLKAFSLSQLDCYIVF